MMKPEKLIKCFKRAVNKAMRPPEPARMTTCGFEAETLSGEPFYRVAEAERKGNGTYDIVIIENAERATITDRTGHLGLNLRQALDFLYEWERKCRRTDSAYALNDNKVPHFDDVAKDFGITLGPDGASLRQAGRAKLVVAQRRAQRP